MNKVILLLACIISATICDAQINNKAVQQTSDTNIAAYIYHPPNILVLIPIDKEKTAYYITTGGEDMNIKVIDNKLLYNVVNYWHSDLKQKIKEGKAVKRLIPVYIKPHSKATSVTGALITMILYENKIKRYSYFTITPEEEALVNAQL